MMSRADSDAGFVEKHSQIVVVNIAHLKRNNAALSCCRTDNFHIGNSLHTFGGIR